MIAILPPVEKGPSKIHTSISLPGPIEYIRCTKTLIPR